VPDLPSILAIAGVVAFFGIVVVAFRTLLPLTIDTTPSGRPDPARLESVRAGRLLAYGSPGGRLGARVGGLTLSPVMFEVWVYDTGLVVKPRFVPAAAIPRAEVDAVRVTRSIEIDHAGRERPSPIVVGVKPDSILGAALLTLAPAHSEAIQTSSASLVAPGSNRGTNA